MTRKPDQDINRQDRDLDNCDLPESEVSASADQPVIQTDRGTTPLHQNKPAIHPTAADLHEEEQAEEERDANRDPITGAPGAHPVGTGIGAAAAGAAGTWAGAAIGATMSGPAAPIGAAVGAVVGAVVGGLAGKGVGEVVNPTDEAAEEAYWRENYATRPYVQPGSDYEDYGPAYRYGWEASRRYPGRSFDEAQNELSGDWDRSKGHSKLAWDRAKDAVRDAWDRVTDRAHHTGHRSDDYNRPGDQV